MDASQKSNARWSDQHDHRQLLIRRWFKTPIK